MSLLSFPAKSPDLLGNEHDQALASAAYTCHMPGMNFEPLLSAAQPIPLHAFLAIFALAAGGIQFALPKGTITHRSLGYAWVAAMFIVAASSFFINEARMLGPFGPIHLLSCLVLVTLWRGVVLARKHAIAKHRRAMIQLYVLALLLAGGFTFLPGRIMHQVLFG